MSGVPRTIRVAYTPHAGQAKLHAAFRAGERFVVAVCGRRWGKTRAALEECRRRMLSRPGVVVRWASPVYGQARARFREMLRLFRELDDAIESSNKVELRIELRNGSEIAFWSVHDPDNLRGEGVNFMVVDEAGYIDAAVWSEALRPMLADTRGAALLIGTPRGRGQFLHQCATRASQGVRGWFLHHAPTWTSPRIAPEEIEAAREELPADAFAQEFGAEFLESAAGVFAGISRCVGGALEGPSPGRTYVLGVDLAQTRDFSVFLVLEAARRQVVHIERMRGVSYVEQVTRIIEVSRQYNSADVVVDETGVGRPVLDNLRVSLGRTRSETEVDRRGGFRLQAPRVTGITLTQQTKQDLIQRLQLDIERARIRIPAECEVLIRELELYGYEMTRSGRISYSAPSGFHDDTVIALALAAFSVPREAVSLDHVDGRLRGLIAQLRPSVRRSHRYGLPRSRSGWVSFAAGPAPEGDLFHEFRLLQVTHAAGLVSIDEARLLASDLRRRAHAHPRYGKLWYSDPLDDEFGHWDDFLAGDDLLGPDDQQPDA